MYRADMVLIMDKMRKIKKQEKRIYSNYYYQLQNRHELLFDIQDSETGIAFGFQDEMVYRVYFYTVSLETLSGLIRDYPTEAVIDLVTKEGRDETEIFQSLARTGYKEYAKFERYHNPNLKETLYDKIPKEFLELDVQSFGAFAQEEELDEVFKQLHEVFDVKESHLQSRGKLKERIHTQDIRIIKENKKIVALVSFVSAGKRLYMEHVFNLGARENIYCLYLYILKRAVSEGINYVYTWINESNERSKNFHWHFSYEKDGTVDYIFVKGI